MTAVDKRSPTMEGAGLAERDTAKRWLVGAVAVLGAAVVGLGIWLMTEVESGSALEDVAIVDQWADAFIEGDPDGVAALFTEDGTYEERGPTQVFEGTQAIRQQLEEAFLYGDATEMTPKTVIMGNGLLSGSGDVIITEWTMSGMSASGARDPSDKTPFSVQAVTLFEMEDGLVSRSVFYASWYDLFN